MNHDLRSKPVQVWLIFGWFFRIGTLACLVIHFAMTLAYVLPVNPVMLNAQELIERIHGHYFAQIWTLFGPDPVSSNYALLVRPLTEAEADSIPALGFPQNGWYDLSSPLWEEFRKNRFSAYDQVYRPQMSSIQSFLSGGTEVAAWRAAVLEGHDLEASKVYERLLSSERDYSTTVLRRVSSSFANQNFARSEFVKIALQIRIESGVPWSKRGLEAPKVRHVELGVYPIDRSVYPAGFYTCGP